MLHNPIWRCRPTMRVLVALSVAVMVLWTNTCRLAAQGTKSEPGAKVGHAEATYRAGLRLPASSQAAVHAYRYFWRSVQFFLSDARFRHTSVFRLHALP